MRTAEERKAANAQCARQCRKRKNAKFERLEEDFERVNRRLVEVESENAALRLHVQTLESRLGQSIEPEPALPATPELAHMTPQKSITTGLARATAPLTVVKKESSHLDYSTHEDTPLGLFGSDPLGLATVPLSPLTPGLSGLGMLSQILRPEPLTPQALGMRPTTLSLTEPSTSTASGDACSILEQTGSTLNDAQTVLSAAESNAYSLVFESFA